MLMCLLNNASFVGIRPISALQINKLTLIGIHDSHIIKCCRWTSELALIQSLTLATDIGSECLSPQDHLSIPPARFTLLSRKSTSCISESSATDDRYFFQSGANIHLPLSHTNLSATKHCFFRSKAYRLGHLTFKTVEPTQRSDQNLVFKPLPTFTESKSIKFLPLKYRLSTSLAKVFQQPLKRRLEGKQTQRPLPPCTTSTTLRQILSVWVLNLQAHLDKRAKLTSLTFEIPNPPFFFDLDTVSQATQLIFLSSPDPAHKNFLISFSICSVIFTGALYSDK
ncbi:hypothetical protein Hanom_Chr12g01168001 [Helianthus anomalus]